MGSLYNAVEPVLAIIAGAIMIVAPGIVAARLRRAHDLRLADRLARGSDAYFEELRSLRAYQPMKRIRAIRLVGLLLVAFGISYFCFYSF